MLSVAVVGCGYWGPNLHSQLPQMPGVRMKTAVDLNKERLRHIGQLYHGVQTTSAFDEVLEDPEIDVRARGHAGLHASCAREARAARRQSTCWWRSRWRPASWKRRR